MEQNAAAAPRPLHFVDGGPGIARRVAYLTRGENWPSAPTGKAIITAPLDIGPVLRSGLAERGLETIAIL